MEPSDLSLLATLDALLQEGSVTKAARRLGLSTPGMSHALARIRERLGDPLLVQLITDRFVCVVRHDHPTVKQRLSLEQFVQLEHVQVAPRGKPGG